MWSNTFEFIVLLFAIILTIWAVHKSKLRVLKAIAKSEQSISETNEILNKIMPNIESMRELNFKFEQYNEKIRSMDIMCILNKEKICDNCGEGGDDCPNQREV